MVDKSSKISSPTGPASPKPRHLAPITPILDEAAIIAQLSVSAATDSTNEYLRTAAVLSIIDAHDRQINRNAYVQIVNRAVQMNERLRELEILCRLRLDLARQTPQAILAAVEGLQKVKFDQAEEWRKGLHEDMERLGACAWEDDQIQ